jgi:hypothetical protein
MDNGAPLHWHSVRYSNYQLTPTQPSRSFGLRLMDESVVVVKGSALVQYKRFAENQACDNRANIPREGSQGYSLSAHFKPSRDEYKVPTYSVTNIEGPSEAQIEGGTGNKGGKGSL